MYEYIANSGVKLLTGWDSGQINYGTDIDK